MALEQLNREQTSSLIQESDMAVECICTDGSSILPLLIFKRKTLSTEYSKTPRIDTSPQIQKNRQMKMLGCNSYKRYLNYQLEKKPMDKNAF